ncbi:DnaJ domain-containing protein [Actinomadura fibrosa]|uniref:DnaJ domain-containing protein n=1 Tax=Actinomadura fibrosa TaxID=111802 RepID=A0ABW2XNR4_9ACTN|nr:DnaJ domain-containing protein [Actinomadura fibrosa]
MTDQRDYYAVLGVPPDASAEQIRTARRSRLREAHPDANPGDPGAAERFDFICKVCEVLGDPERRRIYDQMLRGGADVGAQAHVRCGACAGSGAWGFLRCGMCDGLGRSRMGFSTDCPNCEGSGRVPDPCPRCDGKGWRAASRPARRPSAPPKKKTVQNCYEILGVAPDATAREISERYKGLLREAAAQVPDRVRDAYRRIGDPRRRAGYDRGIGVSPSKGVAGEFDVHVSRRLAMEGAASHEFTVPDRDLCPACHGAGRVMLPCGTCQGRGYWQYGMATTKCDACNGKGTDERPCVDCALSGWVTAPRTLACTVPAASREDARITVRDELLGVVTLRLRLALVPGFVREDG